MTTTFPGTQIEVSSLTKGSAKTLFEGIFATGGITLSQVSVMTGLEPYMVQNWVKRGFLTSPEKRVYSKQQFARIIIINMLKDVLQIDRICGLIHIIAGELNDPTDDLISDEELYYRYVDMIADKGLTAMSEQAVSLAAQHASEDFNETVPGARAKLKKLLSVMYYAHTAARLREKAAEALSTLE